MTAPSTNRTSLASPSGFVLPRRTVTSIPSPAAAAATSAHRRALTSLRRIPAIEEEPRDHRVEPAALDGDLVGLDAAAATPPSVAGGEDGGQVRRPEGARLTPAALGRRSAGSPRGPGPFVPRQGSARRRAEPGSAPRPPPATANLADELQLLAEHARSRRAGA